MQYVTIEIGFFFTQHSAFEILAHVNNLLLLHYWAVILWKECTAVVLSITCCPQPNNFSCFQFLAVTSKTARIVMYRFFCFFFYVDICFYFSAIKCPGIPGTKCVFNFVRNCHFPEQLHHFTVAPAYIRAPISLSTC